MDVEHSSSPKVAKDSLTKESSVSLEDLEALENTMLSTEFDTKEHASEATRKIRERLLKMAVVGQPVVAPKESDSLVRSPGTLQKKPATPLVNTIHSVSVKRVPPQITNNIWHLVKKKKTA